MNECAAAYEEVERATPPPRDQWDRCIEELARTLEPKAVAMIEYMIPGFFRIFSPRHSSRVKAVAALLFIVPPLHHEGRRGHCYVPGNSQNEKRTGPAKPRQLQSDRNGSASTWRNELLSSQADGRSRRQFNTYHHSARLRTIDPLPSRRPCRRLHIRLYPDCKSSDEVTRDDLNRLHRNPDPLLDGGIFMSAEGKVFKVVSITTIAKAGGRDRLFYVSFADEGPEAVAYEEHFFNFLGTSVKLTL
ncbi:hypothetical protein DFH07DRAFT_856595 [Mycena maculata]|uniref:Uncharacterized protein n=1 Tax=Mycena maculata TaxID=230809 RepID=A0AAD7MLX2_9AGAR|nr:hypothetical protein DFH07DRAFT_856595 [Mycena maculata]